MTRPLSSRALIGALLGLALLYGLLLVLRPWIDKSFGSWLPIQPPSAYESWALAGVVLAAIIAGLIPAWRAYRMSLADGMLVKI